jgi:hypothetical protein
MKTYVCIAHLGAIRAKYYVDAPSKKKALKIVKEQYGWFKQFEIYSIKKFDRSMTDFGAERV